MKISNLATRKPSSLMLFQFIVSVLSFIIITSCDSIPLSTPDLPTPTSRIYPAASIPIIKIETLPQFKPIQLAWFYHAPPTDVEPILLVANYDIFISTHGMEVERDTLKSLGSQAPFFQYVVLNEIVAPASCKDQPSHNQVANQPGDFCTIDRLHPDWFLLTKDGQRIHDKEPYENNWQLDPGYAGWREFWINRMQQRENLGWDGIFIDNVEASPRFEEAPLLSYPDTASFVQANLGFLRIIYNSFHPKNIRIFANIIQVQEPDDWFQYLPYLDGAMFENFAVGWKSGEYVSPENWEQQMYMATVTQALGKEIILVAQGDRDDLERQKFALASYLLVNDGKAYFRYTDFDYDKPVLYPNYLLDPGRPLGERYKEGNIWKREFEHGQVIVDPASHYAEIDFAQ